MFIFRSWFETVGGVMRLKSPSRPKWQIWLFRNRGCARCSRPFPVDKHFRKTFLNINFLLRNISGYLSWISALVWHSPGSRLCRTWERMKSKHHLLAPETELKLRKYLQENSNKEITSNYNHLKSRKHGNKSISQGIRHFAHQWLIAWSRIVSNENLKHILEREYVGSCQCYIEGNSSVYLVFYFGWIKSYFTSSSSISFWSRA